MFLHNFTKSVGGTPGFGSKSGENAWFMHNFNTMLGFNTSDLSDPTLLPHYKQTKITIMLFILLKH